MKNTRKIIWGLLRGQEYDSTHFYTYFPAIIKGEKTKEKYIDFLKEESVKAILNLYPHFKNDISARILQNGWREENTILNDQLDISKDSHIIWSTCANIYVDFLAIYIIETEVENVKGCSYPSYLEANPSNYTGDVNKLTNKGFTMKGFYHSLFLTIRESQIPIYEKEVYGNFLSISKDIRALLSQERSRSLKITMSKEYEKLFEYRNITYELSYSNDFKDCNFNSENIDAIVKYGRMFLGDAEDFFSEIRVISIPLISYYKEGEK